jgi:N-sulfoglucosamine sulfohydrolase
MPLPFGQPTPEADRQRTAHYPNTVARVDAGVGLLLDELVATSQATNTVVIFVSDNGIMAPRGKTTSYERGVRVPLLVSWPAMAQPGLVRDELVMLQDLTATLVQAAGATPPPGLVGAPLQPLLRGQSPAWREFLFTEMNFHLPTDFLPQRTVRDARHKLVLNLRPASGTPDVELYDLVTDPWETRNRATDPALASTRVRLQAALHQWREQTEDPLLAPARLQRWVAARDHWDTLSKKQDGIYQITTILETELEKLK